MSFLNLDGHCFAVNAVIYYRPQIDGGVERTAVYLQDQHELVLNLPIADVHNAILETQSAHTPNVFDRLLEGANQLLVALGWTPPAST